MSATVAESQGGDGAQGVGCHRARTRARAIVPSAGWTVTLAATWLLASLPARPVMAQSDSAPVSRYAVAPAIKWGKWAAVAFALGSTAVGIHQHNAGDNAYRTLVLYCGEVITCAVGPDGRYVNAHAEATYQQVVRADRSARVWLTIGQVAAVASAVLFVLELKHEAGPPNIPYSGLTVETAGGVTRVGYRIPVRIGAW